MGWRKDRILRKIEQSGGPTAPAASTDKVDTKCSYCSADYNIGRDGGHHFPACDICGDLGHAGCQHR